MVYPLNGDGKHFLVEINGGYIQQLYKERDEALARNRQLESDRAEWFHAAQEQANALAEKNTALQSLLNDYEAMLTQWDPITEDFKTTGHEYDNQRLALKARYDALLLGKGGQS